MYLNKSNFRSSYINNNSTKLYLLSDRKYNYMFGLKLAIIKLIPNTYFLNS